jgi:hypothetical protein
MAACDIQQKCLNVCEKTFFRASVDRPDAPVHDGAQPNRLLASLAPVTPGSRNFVCIVRTE